MEIQNIISMKMFHLKDLITLVNQVQKVNILTKKLEENTTMSASSDCKPIYKIILWLTFLPISFIGAVLGVKLYFLFSDALFSWWGGFLYPIIRSFLQVIIGVVIFSLLSIKLIPSSNKIKFIVTYLVIFLWSNAVFIINIYFVLFRFQQIKATSESWASTIAISCIAIITLFFLFAKDSFLSILKETKGEKQCIED